jgi:hypothetical protein
MSEIEKYKKYLNFKANPRYLTRDFMVPLYTGTEPDILDDSNTQRESSVYKEFPNEMPIVSPKEIQNQPYEQLQLADGGRANFSEGSKLTGTDKTLEQNIKSDHKAFNDYRKSIGSPTIPLDNEYIRMWIRTRLNKGGSVERQGYASGSPSKLIGRYKIDEKKLNNLRQYLKSLPKDEIILASSLQREFDVDRETIKKIVTREFSNKLKLAGSQGSSINIKKVNIEKAKRVEENISKIKDDYVKDLKTKFKYPSGSFKAADAGVSNSDLAIKYFGSDNPTNIARVERLNARFKNEYGLKYPKGSTEETSLRRLERKEESRKYLSDVEKDILKRQESQKKLLNNYFKNNPKELLKNEKLKSLIDVSLTKEGDLDFTPRYKTSGEYVKLAKEGKLFDVFHTSAVKGEKRNIEYPVNRNIGPSKFNQGFIKQIETFFERTKDDSKYDLKKQTINNYLDSVGYRVQVPDGTYIGAKTLPAIDSKTGRLPNIEKTLANLNLPKLSDTSEYIPPKKIAQFIGSIGCPTIGKSLGGRVNFSEGSNCYAKGLEKIQSGELNTAERNIAANFLKDAGADTKTIGFIKNAKNIGSFLFDAVIGKTPGAALFNFGINVPFAIGEAQEGKPGRQVLGTATDIIGLGPLVGTTEKNELTKAMGADADLYLKLNDAMEEYNDIERQRQLIENSRLNFQSPEEIPSDMREQELQLASKKLDQKEKELYNFLSPYLNKQKEVVYPKNVEKGLQILEDQEKLRKARSNLEMQNIPSIEGDMPLTNNLSFDKSKENINKKIEELESKKPLFGSEIDKNMTPELMDVIYESGARGGAADGGRIGLKEGGGPKIGRRGFLGLLAAGAAAAPEIIKGLKGEKKAVQVAKLASKIKLEKAEGMYPWFPDLIEKIKVKGKPFEEKEIIMEASYKHEPKGYGGLPKGEETVTRHVDGDTEFLLREYPDGRIAVDIHSPRNQEGSSTPVTLYYRPTMELKYYDGVKVEPAEFKVLEKEPRYFANGPDDVDIEMSEMRKVPGQHTIFGDVEAAERFATGKIENRKIIPAKQARREQMEDAPTDFIEETSPYGPETF